MSLGDPWAPSNTGLVIQLTGASQAVQAIAPNGNVFYCYNASNTVCFVDFFAFTATNTSVNTGGAATNSSGPTGVPIPPNAGLLLAAPWMPGNSGWIGAVSANTGGNFYAMPGYGSTIG